ncbi:hypothetical protein B0T16DRAFT_455253 [Cercophora newfieldiana]|uniref:Uncharacterized protein n=1 Tax=Cercophora newfieldiana TaxID=92897 RepID=A0AA39YJX7_9PEZI|nr:hypothetical protein B0T16DRAFT_455253 [Cercophora newfieldiana]
MAPTWSYIIPREGEAVPSDSASSTTKLDTGAIAGIACAAGALFLGGIGLFLVYWRREKRFDKPEEVCERPVEENPFATTSPPVYTLDYKADRASSTTGGSVSSYTYNSEPVRPDSFSPLGGMAYLRTTDGERVPSEIIRFASSNEDSRPQSRASSTAPLRQALQQQQQRSTPPPPRGIPAGLTIPTFTTSRPSQPSPPRLQIDTSTTRPGRDPVEITTITAPAAVAAAPQFQVQPFRQKYHAHLPPPPLTQRAAYDDNHLFNPPPRPRPPPAPIPIQIPATTPTIGRAVTTTTITAAAQGHKRGDSANKRIGDWIAAQPNFRDATLRSVNPNAKSPVVHSPPREVGEETVW